MNYIICITHVAMFVHAGTDAPKVGVLTTLELEILKISFSIYNNNKSLSFEDVCGLVIEFGNSGGNLSNWRECGAEVYTFVERELRLRAPKAVPRVPENPTPMVYTPQNIENCADFDNLYN